MMDMQCENLNHVQSYGTGNKRFLPFLKINLALCICKHCCSNLLMFTFSVIIYFYALYG